MVTSVTNRNEFRVFWLSAFRLKKRVTESRDPAVSQSWRFFPQIYLRFTSGSCVVHVSVSVANVNQ